jgi:hypothetical protein
MNLGALLDFCGNLLDYDPVNATYRDQLVSLLNDAQTRLLTDRPWQFSTSERSLSVWTDTQLDVSVSAGSSAVSGTGFPVSTSTIKPGSTLDGAVLTWTDSGGKASTHTIAWVKATNSLFLDRDYEGVSGTYTATVRRRDIFLPGDCVVVDGVQDPSVGIPAQVAFLSRFEEEDAQLDPTLLGRVEAYLQAPAKRSPAPNASRGIAVVSASSQGARTINVWMVNVLGPLATNFPLYRRDVSDGFESAFSQIATFQLSDSQTLTFTPETIPSRTGLYRRYYFTCPEAGILAPLRIRDANPEQGTPTVGTDTINPEGAITLQPDLSLTTLESQAFRSTAIRYIHQNGAAYQGINLYPHPSADQQLLIRHVRAPRRLLEDQDAPLIPASHSEVLAYATLESLSLKVSNPALAEVYARKKAQVIASLEQAFLQRVPRRIVKGLPIAGQRYVSNPFGPLKFTP